MSTYFDKQLILQIMKYLKPIRNTDTFEHVSLFVVSCKKVNN